MRENVESVPVGPRPFVTEQIVRVTRADAPVHLTGRAERGVNTTREHANALERCS